MNGLSLSQKNALSGPKFRMSRLSSHKMCSSCLLISFPTPHDTENCVLLKQRCKRKQHQMQW